MKRLIMAIVCLMTMVVSVNAQNWSLQAKQNAVKIIKSKLKSPSSFVLTNEYGERISVNKINAEYFKQEIEYDSIVCIDYEQVIDSIEYIYDYKNRIIDSLMYYSYRDRIDSIVYYKKIYYPCYKCRFYYEAQNSYGGMVQDFAYVYVTKNAFISKYLDYEERPYLRKRISSKQVSERPLQKPKIIIKNFDINYVGKENKQIETIKFTVKDDIKLMKQIKRNKKEKHYVDDMYI